MLDTRWRNCSESATCRDVTQLSWMARRGPLIGLWPCHESSSVACAAKSPHQLHRASAHDCRTSRELCLLSLHYSVSFKVWPNHSFEPTEYGGSTQTLGVTRNMSGTLMHRAAFKPSRPTVRCLSAPELRCARAMPTLRASPERLPFFAVAKAAGDSDVGTVYALCIQSWYSPPVRSAPALARRRGQIYRAAWARFKFPICGILVDADSPRGVSAIARMARCRKRAER